MSYLEMTCRSAEASYITLEGYVTSIGHYPHEKDLLGQGMALERDIRGGLLLKAIQVERALDLIIATHLNGDNHQDFINTYFQMLSRTEDGTPRSAIKWFRSRCYSNLVVNDSRHLMKVVKAWQGHFSHKVKFVVLLLKEGYPTLLESPEESISLERQLTTLVMLRNDVAHTESANNVDPSTGQRPDRMVLVYYVDGHRKFKPITLVDAQSKETEWNELFHRLGTVAHQIAKLRAMSPIPGPGT